MGPTREPEDSQTPATAIRTGFGLRHRVFRVGKHASADSALTSDTWRRKAARLGQDSSVTARGDHALWVGNVEGDCGRVRDPSSYRLGVRDVREKDQTLSASYLSTTPQQVPPEFQIILTTDFLCLAQFQSLRHWLQNFHPVQPQRERRDSKKQRLLQAHHPAHSRCTAELLQAGQGWTHRPPVKTALAGGGGRPPDEAYTLNELGK
ncbi:hypothetical protein MC885_018743 [Smutsia gigantea]|nr:hypothetical protein MC885_018743 [Smutsia gigantea]